MTLQLSSIIAAGPATVTATGRLTDAQIAQVLANASAGEMSTRQLLNHFSLFQPEKPHASLQAWAIERGLWATWTTKGGKVKPVGANERRAALVSMHGDFVRHVAEYRIICQYDAIRIMLTKDKDIAERIHKMEQKELGAPVEQAAPEVKETVPSLPPLVDHLKTVQAGAKARLNRLLSQVELDDSLQDFASELRAIAAMLE